MGEAQSALRILHVIHWSNGGVSKVAQELASADGVQSKIIALRDNGAAIDPHLDYVSIDSGWPFKQLARTSAVVRDFRPTIIHAHSLTPLLLALASSVRETPIVRTIHSPYPHFYAKDIRSLVKRRLEHSCHLVGRVTLVCVSSNVAGALPWKDKNAYTIENGVDFERLQRLAQEPIPRPLNDEGKIVIVCMGRLEREKNFPLLLKAFSLATRRTSKQLRLRLLGQGSLRKSLEELARDLGILAQVDFLGHQNNPFPYMRLAHIYMSTSLYEGFSIAFLEAVGLGLPALVTRTGFVPAVFRDREEVLIVEEGEPEQVCGMLMRLIEDQELREKIARRGMQVARANFSLKRMQADYLRLYRRVVR